VLLDDMDREALLQHLRSQFVNLPASEATLREITVLDMVRDAIPSHVEPQGKDVLSLSEAWYISLLASRLGMPGQAGHDGTGVIPGSDRVIPGPDRESLLEKILACRNADGGFGWFEGMHSSPVITAVLLERIEKHESVNSANLGEALSSGEMSLLVRIQQAPVSMTRGDQALGDYISIIRQQAEQRRRKDQPLDFEAIKQSKRETGKRYENG
jgi:hypothetical protein